MVVAWGGTQDVSKTPVWGHSRELWTLGEQTPYEKVEHSPAS